MRTAEDGLCVLNCETLEPHMRFDNILKKSGQLIVFPIKMGYVTRKPRKMKLQIIMLEIFQHMIGVLVPKMNSTAIKEKYITRRASAISHGHFYDRALVRHWPIFHGPMADTGILPHCSLLDYKETLDEKKHRKRTWPELTYIATNRKK